MQAQRCTKVRKIVQTGLFYAELNELLTRELSHDGYGGCEVKTTPSRTEIIIKAANSNVFAKEQGRRLQEIRYMILKRWNIPDEQLEILVDKIARRGLSAINQLDSLRYKIIARLPARRAAYGVIRFVMDAGARGCEVVISGKLRGARAQALKFREGYMVKSGEPSKVFVDRAIGHIPMKQAVVGIRVSIMLPDKQLPDVIKVNEAK